MSNNYKKYIYEKYVTLHNKHIYGEKSEKNFINNFRYYNYLYKPFLPHEKSIRILDIGCGDGNLIFWLQRLGYNHSYGFDISPEQIAIGLKMGINNLYISNIWDLNSQENKYDLIFARDVFEHFTRQELFNILLDLKKILTINGKIVIQVPNGEGIHMNSIFYGDVTHEMAYTKSSLRQIALAAGFNQVDVFPINPQHYTITGFLRFILWKIKVTQLNFWRYVERGNASGIYTANITAVIR